MLWNAQGGIHIQFSPIPAARGVPAHDADRVRFDPPLVIGLDDNVAGSIER
jgi:hypothetical protein